MKNEKVLTLIIVVVVFTITYMCYGTTLVFSQVNKDRLEGAIEAETIEVEEVAVKFVEEDILEEVEEVEEVIVEEEVVKEVHFNNQNVLEVSNVTTEQLHFALKGTALYELAPVYVEAEQLHGVNALFIVSLTAQESGWGKSDRAVNDNNLTGFGVYADSSEGINAPTKRDNIIQTAGWLKKAYLSNTGEYFNGHSINSINKRYCIGKDGQPDYNWSKNITSIGFELLDKIKSS